MTQSKLVGLLLTIAHPMKNLLLLLLSLMYGFAYGSQADCDEFAKIKSANGWDMMPILRSLERSNALQNLANGCIRTMYESPENLISSYEPLMNPPMLGHRRFNGVSDISWQDYKNARIVGSRDVVSRFSRALKAYPVEASYLLGRFYSDSDNCGFAGDEVFCRTEDAYNYLLVALKGGNPISGYYLSRIQYTQSDKEYLGLQRVTLHSSQETYSLNLCIQLAQKNSSDFELEKCLASFISSLGSWEMAFNMLPDASVVIRTDVALLIHVYKKYYAEAVKNKNLVSTISLVRVGSLSEQFSARISSDQVDSAFKDIALSNVDVLGIPRSMQSSEFRKLLESRGFYSSYELKSKGKNEKGKAM